MKSFNIRNLGPIENVSIDFGDLTILIGAQASGKSLALETLKLVIDYDNIISILRKYNYIIKQDANRILNLFYGEGLAGIWKENTEIRYDESLFTGDVFKLRSNKKKEEQMFYIPAQRILSIADGRPKHFMEFDTSSPYILRSFSETLRLLMQGGMGNTEVLFPIKNRLKDFLRHSIDDNIFHEAKVVMVERAGQKKMALHIDDMHIPFMAWSAGQKEFMPLLLAFYCVSGPPNGVVKKERFKYVVIEEPEMGLHPRAIISVILQILEFMQGGFKVIVSTHSPVFLEFAWAFNLLKKTDKVRDSVLYDIFDAGTNEPIKNMLRGLFNKNIKTYYFSHNERNGKVVSKDISILDVADDDDMVANWGGLSEFASKVSDVVSKYMVEDE